MKDALAVAVLMLTLAALGAALGPVATTPAARAATEEAEEDFFSSRDQPSAHELLDRLERILPAEAPPAPTPAGS